MGTNWDELPSRAEKEPSLPLALAWLYNPMILGFFICKVRGKYYLNSKVPSTKPPKSHQQMLLVAPRVKSLMFIRLSSLQNPASFGSYATAMRRSHYVRLKDEA